MINYFDKKSMNSNLMSTSLTKFLSDGNCIYQIIGKAERNENVNIKLYNILRKYVNDPTKHPFISRDFLQSKVKSLDMIKNSRRKTYFTSCTFCLSGKKCFNEINNRFFTVDFMTKNGKRSIKICHPDISKCRNRITLGLHIDFSFTYNGRYLEITDIFPLKEKYNIPKKKDSFKDDNAQKFDINFDFPSLNSTIKIVNVSSSNNYSSALSSTTDIIDTKTKISCNSTVAESEDECNLKEVTAKTDIELDIEANIEANIETESDSFSELVSSNTKKIIVPPELIKKLNFTLNHLNNEREILKKSFIELENETMKEVQHLEEDLYNKYGRIVNDTDFTYSIS
jgi:hypothetical protein